ncbi:metal-dependent hydrolase [Cohnella endophytica]|uniref:Metal-dependent hydrolase n=1 Tax=Cohnella endophytica TaxID=2419778 RepID=A0A494Y6D9_9BACL|nr:metal-dependent hydrolase [Cohnella endophytica]RKP58239.1 metal-dependent hydrolase [Cohnella endophytica]
MARGGELDSISHLTIGSTLAGLLTAIPVISNHHEFMLPIMISCIIGSLAPDLDVISRLKPELYLRYHRGASHSFFLFPFWSLLVAGLLSACWLNIPFLLLWFSVSAGYLLHIVLDLLNSYGTQIAYPFRTDRKGYHVLPLFDLVLWSAHAVFAVIWLQQGLGTGFPFTLLYAGSVAYIGIRFYYRTKIKKQLESKHSSSQVLIFPTFSLFNWSIVLVGHDAVQAGVWRYGNIIWQSPINLGEAGDRYVKCSEQTDAVKLLKNFSPYLAVQKITHPDGIKIRWLDLRYLERANYCLMACVLIDQSYTIQRSYIGWFKPEGE